MFDTKILFSPRASRSTSDKVVVVVVGGGDKVQNLPENAYHIKTKACSILIGMCCLECGLGPILARPKLEILL